MNILSIWLEAEAREKNLPFVPIIDEGEVYTLEQIADKYGLKAKSRKRELVSRKHFFSWFCYCVLNMTAEATISLTSHENHSSAIHSSKETIKHRETGDKVFASEVADIKKDLETIKIITKWTELRGHY